MERVATDLWVEIACRLRLSTTQIAVAACLPAAGTHKNSKKSWPGRHHHEQPLGQQSYQLTTDGGALMEIKLI